MDKMKLWKINSKIISYSICVYVVFIFLPLIDSSYSTFKALFSQRLNIFRGRTSVSLDTGALRTPAAQPPPPVSDGYSGYVRPDLGHLYCMAFSRHGAA